MKGKRGLGIVWLHSMRLLVSIAFVALLVRAMVPDGWMIMPDPETGRASIQPCTGRMVPLLPVSGDNAAQHAMPMEGGDAHQGHHGHHVDAAHQGAGSDDHGDHAAQPACPFALGSLVAMAGDAFLLLDPYRPAAPDRTTPPTRAPPVRIHAHAPLPARGPPSFV